ncbi:MAG: leucine-rich repeat domain-containing protein, partial [Alistipes sp.]|nr:leucine-rich repeat domain-containing protein [Alistipes sp.]
MKKLFLFALVATMFAACVTDETQDVAVGIEAPESSNPSETPETLTVSFEEADSRIQLNEAGKTVWTQGDEVSVFYKSYDNLKFKFDGETGDRSGTLTRVDGSITTQTMDHTIVAYPYSSDYRISLSTGGLDAMLPATQYYAKDSYGIGSNLMVAQSEFAQFSLKNVCGWLKIQLTGNGQVVKSITLKGNNNEQVAGLVHINTADATSILASTPANEDDPSSVAGNLVLDGSILTSVTLDCGKGVTLGTKATAFYIALPPQSFEKGLTIEVACTDGSAMTKSTTNAITIARNAIQPMAAFEAIFPEPKPANNEIWYTATEKVEPYKNDGFGANIVSNEWDETTSKGVITFDANVTSIGVWAFSRCSLTSITIPDSVTSIGDYAFYGCSSLTNITIPDSITSIGGSAFSECSSLKVFYGKLASADNRCLIVDGVLTSFAPAGLTEYSIPDSVTSIGECAFAECIDLTSVTIPNSVTSIGSYAFSRCSLTSITIPDSVTSFGNLAFSECLNMTSFYGKFASEDNCCLIVDGVLYSFAVSCD